MSAANVRPTRGPKVAVTQERILQTVFPPMVKVDEINDALTDLRETLFRAMGIVRMASNTIREPSYRGAETDAWTSLNTAHEILCGVVDRLQSTETMFAEEVSRGEY